MPALVSRLGRSWLEAALLVGAPGLLLAQDGVLHRGRVRDGGGAPVASASLDLRGAASTYRAVTDARGEYRISGLPVAAYVRRVRRIGFRPYTDTIRVTSDAWFPVTMTSLAFTLDTIGVRRCVVVRLRDVEASEAAEAIAQVGSALDALRELFETWEFRWTFHVTSDFRGRSPDQDVRHEEAREVWTTPRRVAARFPTPVGAVADSLAAAPRWAIDDLTPIVELQLAMVGFPAGYCIAAGRAGDGLRVDFTPDTTGYPYLPSAARLNGTFYLRGTLGRLDSLVYGPAVDYRAMPRGPVRAQRFRVAYQSVFVDRAEVRVPIVRDGRILWRGRERWRWRVAYLGYHAFARTSPVSTAP